MLAKAIAILTQLTPLVSTLMQMKDNGLDDDDRKVIQALSEATDLLSDVQDKLSDLMADGEVTDDEINALRQRQHDLVTRWNELVSPKP